MGQIKSTGAEKPDSNISLSSNEEENIYIISADWLIERVGKADGRKTDGHENLLSTQNLGTRRLQASPRS